jgi:hypothetical protein
MGRIDETVVVLVDAFGVPTCIRWREKDYLVDSRPVRWFARTQWWIGERAQRGIGSGALEVEMWRFMASPSDDSGSYFELLHNSIANSWKLVRKFE